MTDHILYKKMLEETLAALPGLSPLNGKDILITGANGMIGTFLIDLIMLYNSGGGTCGINAVVRNKAAAEERFGDYIDNKLFRMTVHNVNDPFTDITDIPDYIIHAASNTHPIAYANDPINTIMSNVYGTKNLLELASEKSGCRFVCLSTVDIYGENRGDAESFDERYCGYIDCNTLRAGYPESKRTSEALCQAYIKEKNADCVIVRIPRTYGPTMKLTDTKASSQFILKAVNSEDIVLKSAGTQVFSYACVADVVSGILTVMLRGECGEAYNIADSGSDVQLRELAQIAASSAGKKVVFGESGDTEKQGASKVTRAVMNAEKLRGLGWRPVYDIRSGIDSTIKILIEKQ